MPRDRVEAVVVGRDGDAVAGREAVRLAGRDGAGGRCRCVATASAAAGSSGCDVAVAERVDALGPGADAGERLEERARRRRHAEEPERMEARGVGQAEGGAEQERPAVGELGLEGRDERAELLAGGGSLLRTSAKSRPGIIFERSSMKAGGTMWPMSANTTATAGMKSGRSAQRLHAWQVASLPSG